MGRYDRQLILEEIGEEGQRKLASARVLIVGVGGLGSPASLYLAGAGVGTIGLLDDDVVSAHNLQRQVLYSENQIGTPKALCAAQRLTQLNSSIVCCPHVCRLTEANARDILAGYDVVVDGCDNFQTRYLMDDVCRELNIPYVYGAIGEFSGQVSVFNYGTDRRYYRDLYPDESAMLELPAPSKGVMGVTPGIVGTMLASEALKILAGYGTVLSGSLWTIDLKTGFSSIFTL